MQTPLLDIALLVAGPHARESIPGSISSDNKVLYESSSHASTHLENCRPASAQQKSAFPLFLLSLKEVAALATKTGFAELRKTEDYFLPKIEGKKKGPSHISSSVMEPSAVGHYALD